VSSGVLHLCLFVVVYWKNAYVERKGEYFFTDFFNQNFKSRFISVRISHIKFKLSFSLSKFQLTFFLPIFLHFPPKFFAPKILTIVFFLAKFHLSFPYYMLLKKIMAKQVLYPLRHAFVPRFLTEWFFNLTWNH
jgi:hypothetical protein